MYPFIRDNMLSMYGAKEGEKPKVVMLAAGFTSGAFGYFFCTPIYQVKTLAQAEAGMVVDGKLISGAKAGKTLEYTPFMTGLNRLKADGAMFRGVGAVVTRGCFFSAGN